MTTTWIDSPTVRAEQVLGPAAYVAERDRARRPTGGLGRRDRSAVTRILGRPCYYVRPSWRGSRTVELFRLRTASSDAPDRPDAEPTVVVTVAHKVPPVQLDAIDLVPAFSDSLVRS